MTLMYRVRGIADGELESWLGEIGRPAWQRLASDGSLGEGGMGEVDRVFDPSLLRHLARKRIGAVDARPEALHLFAREARILSQLDHPNIAPLHDVGRTPDGSVFFTMKLVVGRTLHDWREQLPPQPLSQGALLDALEVVRKVCDALAFAHSRGVLHCDIKAENIMLGDFGEAYLMDWGVARLLEDPAEHDEPMIMGTPAFMAPEQAFGRRKELDPRADVFGIGALIYYVLCRQSPYGGERLAEVVLAAQRGLAQPPSERIEEVPPELERIVLKAMAPNPDDRYPSITDLSADLQRFVRGGGDFPRVTYVEGAAIVREGDPGDAAYIIVSGLCEVTKRVDGNVVVLRRMGPGELFGETAILTDEPRTASVVAKEDTTVYVVTNDVIEREMDTMKPWMGAFVRTLAKRFREADAVAHSAR